MKKRIGNDITGLSWQVSRHVKNEDGEIITIPEDFSECFDINIVAFNTRVRTHKITPEFGIQQGKILLNIPASVISELGIYTILLEYKRPSATLESGIATYAIDWKNAFEIVSETTMEDAAGKDQSSIVRYDGGKNAYDYWLEYHEGTVEDFVKWMQRPAIIAALRVDAYINNAQSTIDELSERVSDVEADLQELLSEPDEIQQFANYLSFPNLGNDKVLYIDIETSKSYRWDPDMLKYFEVSQLNIEIINGGN